MGHRDFASERAPVMEELPSIREIESDPHDYNLKGRTLPELETIFKSLGEPSYRAKQAFRRINMHMAISLDEFSEFSKPFREKLAELDAFPSMEIVESSLSRDGTEKVVFRAGTDRRDGSPILIETVWLVSGKRRTVCVSTQAGCSLNCAFCATGTLPFKGNLPAWQIVEQVYAISRHRGELPTNVVYMGMGEPMFNYDNVIRASHILHDEEGLHMSARHITISTAGVVPGIEKLAASREPFNLAVSLNQPDPTTRGEIMDVDRKYPLDRLLVALKRYTATMRRHVTFEYVMIPGVNMDRDHAAQLIRIAKSVRSRINLIPLNTSLHGWRPPSDDEVVDFQERLLAADLYVFNRGSAGKDINGACGMLALKSGGKK